MRLTPEQKATIQRITSEQLGKDYSVWVYGSRLDDTRRGGDLDVLVKSQEPIDLWQRAGLKLALEAALHMPVDILSYQQGSEPTVFQSIALEQAVPLEQMQ